MEPDSVSFFRGHIRSVYIVDKYMVAAGKNTTLDKCFPIGIYSCIAQRNTISIYI